MKQGREGANKTIAEGEVWGEKTDAQKASFMKKVKDIQKVKAFGGVEAEAAGIERVGGVNDAIALGVTEAVQKASQRKGAVEGLQKEAEDTGKEKGKSAAQVMEDTANTMSRSKIASDVKSIETADEKYKDKGGYIGLNRDNAMLQSQQMAGTTSGLLNTPKEHRANFIEGALDKAALEGTERFNDVKKAFQNAGLVNDKGEATPENWVSGTSFLKANNMNSHNALVAGGMAFSGAIGENSSIQATAIDSLNAGSETKFNQQTKSLSQLFNKGREDENKLALTSGGDIDYKNTSQQALADFAKYAQTSNLAKHTKDDFLTNFVAKVATETGAPEEAVWASMSVLGAVAIPGVVKGSKAVAGATAKVAKKISPFNTVGEEETLNSTDDNGNGKDTDDSKNNHSQHKTTPDEKLKYSKDQINESRASIENYSKELEAEQAKKNPNTQKISDLQESIVKETDNLEANRRSYTETYAKQQAHNNRSVFEKVKDTLKPSEGLKDLVSKGIKGAGVGLAFIANGVFKEVGDYIFQIVSINFERNI